MKRKIFIIILIIILILVFKSTKETSIIPDTSIRLRVIPNSNQSEDIYIKEKIKTYLETNLYPITKDSTSIEDTRTIIENNIPIIKENIDNIFKENNYQQTYNINYGNNYFPEKEYNGIIYNEGYYESLVISIGNAEGSNFWCVLFPNTCLIDTSKSYTYKLYIKELISKYTKK